MNHVNNIRLVSIVDDTLRKLNICEKDISKILNIIYTNILRNNLKYAYKDSRVCSHGYTINRCDICSERYDYKTI